MDPSQVYIQSPPSSELDRGSPQKVFLEWMDNTENVQLDAEIPHK